MNELGEKQESKDYNICHRVSTSLFSFLNVILGSGLKQQGHSFNLWHK